MGPVVWEMHRRFGKSFVMALMGIERCLQKSRQVVRYAAPNEEQCREIIIPSINEILSHCPGEFQPRKRDNTWLFPHPDGWDSEFILIGCREGAKVHRGKASDMVLLDECRDVEELEEVATVVFGFHFAGRWQPIEIMASTPPDMMDHPFIQRYCGEAQKLGSYFTETVETNEDWTAEDDAAISELCGGKGTIAWEREALCRHIADPKGLIVPEFVDLERRGAMHEVVVGEYERPPYFHSFIAIDGGYEDHTAVLFGYIDWKKALLIVEDELWEKQLNSGQWEKLISAKQEELYGHSFHKTVRFGDLPKQQQADMAQMLHFPVLPVQKYDKSTSLADLRLTVQEKRLRIHSRCKNLCYQLRNGIWKENRKDFIRSEKLGHCDLIDSLIYLHRMAYWNTNPYPVTGYTFHARDRDIFIPATDDQPDVLRVLRESEYDL